LNDDLVNGSGWRWSPCTAYSDWTAMSRSIAHRIGAVMSDYSSNRAVLSQPNPCISHRPQKKPRLESAQSEEQPLGPAAHCAHFHVRLFGRAESIPSRIPRNEPTCCRTSGHHRMLVSMHLQSPLYMAYSYEPSTLRTCLKHGDQRDHLRLTHEVHSCTSYLCVIPLTQAGTTRSSPKCRDARHEMSDHLAGASAISAFSSR
jgi:hypothetical protein